MSTTNPFLTDDKSVLFEAIADELDIPPSYYQKASDRFRSLGKWLHRDDSKVADLNPGVVPLRHREPPFP
jgi:hypothetical protein